MSVIHCSLGRLPVEIFTNLVVCSPVDAVVTAVTEEQKNDRENLLWTTTTMNHHSCKGDACVSVPASDKNNNGNNTHGFHAQMPDPVALRSAIVEKWTTHSMTTASSAASRHIMTTIGDFLQLSPMAHMRLLDPLLTYEECCELHRRICHHVAPPSISAWDLLCNEDSATTSPSSYEGSHHLHHHNSLATGFDPLNDRLRGGLRIGTITEIVGPAGSGKTQLALQMAIATASNHGGGTIYIDTEHKLSLPRFLQMSEHHNHTCLGKMELVDVTRTAMAGRKRSFHSDDYDSASHGVTSTVTVEMILNNTTIHTPSTMDDLLVVLNGLEDEICRRQLASAAAGVATTTTTTNNDGGWWPVRLIVVDSIAAPLRRRRSELGITSTTAATTTTVTATTTTTRTTPSGQHASTQLVTCAQILKRLADQYHLAVVVINHQVDADHSVMDRSLRNTNTTGSSDMMTTSSTIKTAALGVAWYHCVSTRIVMLEGNDEGRQPPLASNHVDVAAAAAQDSQVRPLRQRQQRQLNVVKSPLVGVGEPIPFVITEKGLVAV